MNSKRLISRKFLITVGTLLGLPAANLQTPELALLCIVAGVYIVAEAVLDRAGLPNRKESNDANG